MADHGEIKLRDIQIKALIDRYHAAYKDITETIINDTTAGKINKARTMATIRAQLQGLGDDVDAWTKREIPQYYLDGANVAVQDLKKMGVALDGPKGLAPINKDQIASLVDSTNLAFAQSLTAVSRNSEKLLASAVKQQLTYIIADGTLKGDARKLIADNIRNEIESNGISALVDGGGKSWAFDTYAEMLVRTKAVESRNEGLKNKMSQNGYDLVQVSDHNSDHQECADWEGAILSVTGNTPGYDTTDDAEAEGLMHPNCQHAYNVIDPDLADMTSAYDNPYNDDAAAADPGDPESSSGDGKVQTFDVFHGTGGDSFNDGTDLFGNAYYVSRSEDTASKFGDDITQSAISVKPSEILTIADDKQYNQLITSALKAYPGDDIQKSLPQYASDLGYKAIEGTPGYDPLAGIAIIDNSILKKS